MKSLVSFQSFRWTLFILAAIMLVGCAATPATPIPQPDAMGRILTSDRLACPQITSKSTQADHGAYVYCQVCMVCHGDEGQGLVEWQKVLEPPDNNCFQHRCHGPSHPSYGFEIPRSASVVMGPGLLDHFGTALELHNYLKATMPWQDPGYLKPDEYWQLTAFLLRANGIDLGNRTLNENNSAKIQIKTKPGERALELNVLPYAIAGVALALAVLAWMVFILRRPRKR